MEMIYWYRRKQGLFPISGNDLRILIIQFTYFRNLIYQYRLNFIDIVNSIYQYWQIFRYRYNQNDLMILVIWFIDNVAGNSDEFPI